MSYNRVLICTSKSRTHLSGITYYAKTRLVFVSPALYLQEAIKLHQCVSVSYCIPSIKILSLYIAATFVNKKKKDKMCLEKYGSLKFLYS